MRSTAYLEKSKVGSVPCWEEDGGMRAVASVCIRPMHAVPRDKRSSMNTYATSDIVPLPERAWQSVADPPAI